jgi:hypothetical protein
MPYASFDVVGSYDKDQYNIIDSQFTGNMYEIINPESPEGKALVTIPGSKLALDLELGENSGCRAMYRIDRFMFGVFRDKVYQLVVNASNGTLQGVLIGTLTTTSGFVGISSNLTQVIFVDGAKGWIWDQNNFTEIVDANFPANPRSVTYLDGRFVVSSDDTNQFGISFQEDGTQWEANTAQLTTRADTIVNMAMLKRRIFIFGQNVTECWYDAADPTFPFERDNTQSFEFGLAARASLAVNNGYMIWLGISQNGSPTVYLSEGGDAVPISTPQVEFAIQNYDDWTDAYAYLYTINGHDFYVINFTTDDQTFVYDITMRKWFTQFMADESRYFGQAHAFFEGRHFVGHYNQSKIYEVSHRYRRNVGGPDDAGEPIRKVRITKAFRPQDGHRIAINMFELRCRQGDFQNSIVDTDNIYTNPDSSYYTNENGEYYTTPDYYAESDVETEPVIYLSVSRDNGKTYGWEIPRRLGAVGQTTYKTIWNRFGFSDSFVFKIESFTDIPLVIIGAAIQYDVLRF